MGRPSCRTRHRGLIVALALAALWVAPAAGWAAPAWMDRSLSPDERARLVVAAMTLDEKLGMVHGATGMCVPHGADAWVPGIARLGVPDLLLIGAGAGVSDVCQRDRFRALNDRMPPGPATELPVPIARAASFSTAVARMAGDVIGAETRVKGFNVSIGGMVNLARDPRHGRTFEGSGEDPHLTGALVAAEIRAIQSHRIVADVKHYAANEYELGRFTTSSNVDERTLRELYLPPFERAVQAGVGAVMCAYNAVNGTQACEHPWLLDAVLKREWGFKGWVMSDWILGTRSTVAAALAGLDQEQPQGVFFGEPLRVAVLAGTVPAARLDDMVLRILRTMFAAGIVDDPPVIGELDVEAGARAAQAIEERSAVLLKNERDALPLDPARTRSIAVIGGDADRDYPAPGGVSSAQVTPTRPIPPLQGIRERVPAATVTYDAGSDHAAAAALARRSDVAIVFARDSESEFVDRRSLALDGDADSLIAAVAAAQPRTIVVLETGGPVTMPWLAAVPAVLEAWYPGQSGGRAIARLLFGDANPSGRLPITFPRRLEDMPTAQAPDQWPAVPAGAVEYREGLLVGYRWYDARGIEPLFAFGHGLAYRARFAYSRLRVRRRRGGGAAISFRVRNRGTRTAVAVPQVYVSSPALPGARPSPPKSLRAFRRLTLGAHRSRAVRLVLPPRAFAQYDTDAHCWRVLGGRHGIVLAQSARDVRAHQTVALSASCSGPAG